MAKYWGTPHFSPKIFFSKMTQNGLEWILNTTFVTFLDAIASLYLIMSVTVTVTVTQLCQNITKKTFIKFIATFKNY